jgi:hypothetical protein
MKKLSAVQRKQQALVMDVAEKLEQLAASELEGVVQCWFSMEYHLFPSSLLYRLQFADQAAMDNAQPLLPAWQKRVSAMMLKKGVILKDMRLHLVFTISGSDE